MQSLHLRSAVWLITWKALLWSYCVALVLWSYRTADSADYHIWYTKRYLTWPSFLNDPLPPPSQTRQISHLLENQQFRKHLVANRDAANLLIGYSSLKRISWDLSPKPAGFYHRTFTYFFNLFIFIFLFPISLFSIERACLEFFFNWIQFFGILKLCFVRQWTAFFSKISFDKAALQDKAATREKR